MTRKLKAIGALLQMTGSGCHIVLIGYRASGKTTVGLRLAEALQLPWVDLDAQIEERCQRRIAEIFEQSGEDYFRDRESECLSDLCTRVQPQVISTGGGVILRPENRQLLRNSSSVIVYLKAPAAVLSARLRKDAGDRPSLTGASVEEEVAAVLAQRSAAYEETATHVVDASNDCEWIVQYILKIVEN